MDTIIRSTQLASRVNPDLKFDIILPFYFDDNTPTPLSLYTFLSETFKEDIKQGKISLFQRDTAFGKIIFIKGIMLWDNVPITNMEIWFNPDEKITEISGDFFTFMGNNTISDISNIDPLWSLSSHYIKEEKYKGDKVNHLAFIHYVNGEKFYIRNADGSIRIILNIRPEINDEIQQKTCKCAYTGKTGLPIIIKQKDTFTIESVSCKGLDTNNLRQLDEITWEFKSPAFIPLSVGRNLIITRVVLIPSKNASNGEDAPKWETIKLNVTGHIETIDILKPLADYGTSPKQVLFLLNAKIFLKENSIISEHGIENNSAALLLKNLIH